MLLPSDLAISLDCVAKMIENCKKDPEVISNQELWRKLCKEHSDISPIVEKYKQYKLLNDNIAEAKEIEYALGDAARAQVVDTISQSVGETTQDYLKAVFL